MNAKSVVLLSTHFLNDHILKVYKKLALEIGNKYDVCLLLNTNDKNTSEIPSEVKAFVSDLDAINNLGYTPIRETLLPGSCHFPLLCFYRKHHCYKYYWFIEYDVYFSGNWSVLFNDCDMILNDYDFLSAQVAKYDSLTNGNWLWWTSRNNSGFPLEKSVKGFNPICRYSRKALECLDRHLSKGYYAHSEVMITTCLYNNQLRIGDFGGQGKFVPTGWENKYYIPKSPDADDGSIRYRPVFSINEINSWKLKNKIFHPLKG